MLYVSKNDHGTRTFLVVKGMVLVENSMCVYY